MRRGLIVMLSALLLSVAARAYDFAETAPTGQTLYFNIVEGGVVVVYPYTGSYPVYGWSGYSKPSGNLRIPAVVSHEGQNYAVLAVSNHAFYECDALNAVYVEEGVRSLRQNAFNYCTGLATISLPASLDTLAAAAIGNCTALQELTMRGATPPQCTGLAFSNLDLSGITLNVPCGGTAGYASASVWSNFSNVSESECVVTISAMANYDERGTVTGTGSYAPGTTVTLTATPTAGYFFACWNDGDTNNPRVMVLNHETALTALFFALAHDTVAAEVVHDTVTDTVRMVVAHTDTVEVEVHDTVRMVVTLTDTVAVEVHDTVRLVVVQTDTVVNEVHDTLTIYSEGRDTLYVRDTVALHDTLTVYLTEPDTITLHDTVAVVDTVYVDWPYYVVDTVLVHDTIVPTFFRLTVDAADGGIGIGNAILPAGTLAEIGAIAEEGHVFRQWDDGSVENPRKVTMTGNITLTALFETVGILGIDEVEWTATVKGRTLTVNALPGSRIAVYDMHGRVLLNHTSTSGTTTVMLSSAGVYLVAVDGGSARKIVISD